MREDFNKILHQYNEHAKDAANMLSKDGRTKHQEITNKITEEAAVIRKNTPETQDKIFNIQKNKQNAIQKMHKQFRKLDAGKDLEKFSFERTVTYDDNFDQFYFLDEDGLKSPISRSEILTDGEWGLSYNFDNTVPKILIKEYILTETKRQVSKKLDEQIILDEIDSSHTDSFKKLAYKDLYENKNIKDRLDGFLAERMIKGLLTKISLEGVDFEIEEADVYQDVEQKIDFIIRRKNHNRAVGVTEDEKVIGIQFTLNKDKEEHKKKQLKYAKRNLTHGSKRKHERGIDDIMLVVMPLDKISKMYKAWQEKKTPGGPEMLWDDETKRSILSGVLKDLVPEDEIYEIFNSKASIGDL